MPIFSYGSNSVDKIEYLLKQAVLLDKNIFVPKKDDEILRPKGAWIPVLILENSCLFYRVPNNEIKGELIFAKKFHQCTDEYDKEIFARLDDVSSLIIKLNKKMKISFFQKSKKYTLSFDFFDFDNENLVFYLKGNENKVNKLKSNDICRSFNNECEIDKDFCFKCPHAWFELIQKKCPTKKIRKCGLNNCGSKGENACADGRGICAKGLKPQWNDQGILVCI